MRRSEIHIGWYCLTVTMVLCLTISTLCTTIQVHAIQWFQKTRQSQKELPKRTLILLYMVYIMACFCSIQCLLCHLSNHFNHQAYNYCKYGMSLCVMLYMGQKSFLYGFLIERAKSTQNMLISTTSSMNTFWIILLQYMLPIYIFIYFTIMATICMIYFRGQLVLPSINDNQITGCLFDQYIDLVFVIGAIADFINSIGLLFLFLYPLCITIKTYKKHCNENAQSKHKLSEMITTIKLYLFCTMFSTISCVLFFLCMSYHNDLSAEQFLWFFGNIELMINSLCTFCMIKPNRSYVSQQLLCGCGGWTCHNFINCKFNINDKKQINDLQLHSISTATVTVTNTSVYSNTNTNTSTENITISNVSHTSVTSIPVMQRDITKQSRTCTEIIHTNV